MAIVTKLNCLDLLNKDISNACCTQLEHLNTVKNNLLTQNIRNELSEVFNTVMTQIRQNDTEVVKLFENEIGIKSSNLGFIAYDLHRFDVNRPTLNDAGLALAKKLKLIYKLIQ